MRLLAPKDQLIRRLSSKGICDSKGNPICKAAWIHLDDGAVITSYNAVLTGLLNYYSFAGNPLSLKHIQYVLQMSAAKTLCRKHQVSIKAMFSKRGTELKTVAERDSDGNPVRFVRLNLRTDWSVGRKHFLTGNDGGPRDTLELWANLYSRSKLGKPCCICGESDSVEMHHVRHIRKGKAKGFAQILAQLNRKQIPVCRPCHVKIHAGKYDGISLSDFSYPALAAA